MSARHELLAFPIGGIAWEVIQGSELSISAQTYDGGSEGAVDALAALQGAHRRKRGKGYSYELRATVAGATCLADYLWTMAEVYAHGDADARKEGRACATAAQVIDAALTARANALAVKPREMTGEML